MSSPELTYELWAQTAQILSPFWFSLCEVLKSFHNFSLIFGLFFILLVLQITGAVILSFPENNSFPFRFTFIIAIFALPDSKPFLFTHGLMSRHKFPTLSSFPKTVGGQMMHFDFGSSRAIYSGYDSRFLFLGRQNFAI